MKPTQEGPAPIGKLNPFETVQGETMAFSQGIKSEWNKKQNRVWVSDIHNGDWIKLREVDFSKAPSTITVTAASALQGGQIEVHLDSIKGEKIATVDIAPTGGWEEWEDFSAPISKIQGTRDVFFLFKGLKGCKLFNLDKWFFKE
jgi:hypothetical protein